MFLASSAILLFPSATSSEKRLRTRSVSLTTAQLETVEIFLYFRKYENVCLLYCFVPSFLIRRDISATDMDLCCLFERNVKSASRNYTREAVNFLLEQYFAAAAQFAPSKNIIKLKIYKLHDSQR